VRERRKKDSFLVTAVSVFTAIQSVQHWSSRTSVLLNLQESAAYTLVTVLHFTVYTIKNASFQ